jgi:signal transduction histidine kinase
MAEGGAADERRAGHGRARGTRRRLLAARASEPGAAERAADVQALLAQTLGALLRETRVERAAVWARDPSGHGVVLAALGDSPSPSAAEIAALAASASLGRLARLDAEVRRLDRLAALGELVAEIVHEIRNPLVSVKTFLQLLPERAAEPEFQGRFREVAAEELRRIERLLDLVLAHARPGTATRESDHTLLSGSCQSVLQLVSHRAADLGISLELAGASPPLRVALSDDALRQVVLNLVLNALDVTPRGGRVRLALAAAGGQAELRVEDEGPGVPEALRERVFEAFYSSKPGAPGGLGLAITRRIVEEAGGSIAALAGEPAGGCFRVCLPLA